MKKANLINFIIIAIIFILFYIIHFYFIQNNIDIYYQFNFTENLENIVIIDKYAQNYLSYI